MSSVVVASGLTLPFTSSAQAAGLAPEAALRAALAAVPGLLPESAGVPTRSDTDSALRTATGEVAVDVPRDPSRGVDLSGESGLSLGVKPAGADAAGDATPVAAGVVGYAGSAQQTDSVVQVLPDGARLLQVMYGRLAPGRFAFPLELHPGSVLEPADGGYRITAIGDQTAATIEAPWALDARGRSLPAHYELSGSTVTLVVDHSAAVYPVVADPTIRTAGKPSDDVAGNPLNGGGAGGATAFGCGQPVHQVRNTACQNGTVNSRTGEFTMADTDLTRPGRGPAFALTRTYRSGRTAIGAMGPGWTHSYAASLSINTTNGNVVLDGEDGEPLTFFRQSDGSYTAAAVGRSKLSKLSDGRYELTRRDQVRYIFDTVGDLTEIIDRNDNTMTVTQAGGQVDVVTDQQGRRFDFGYTNGRLTSVAADSSRGDTRTVRYGYTNGRLTSVTDPMSKTTSFSYDANGKIETLTDRRGNTAVTNTYTNGRVSRQVDANGDGTDFAWDATAQRSTMTDANGDSTADTYNGNNLMSRTSPRRSAGYTYDARGNRTSTTDKRGVKNRFTYDANDNQNGSYADEGLPTQSTTKATFDGMNNLLTSTDAAGLTTTNDYDANGNLQRTTAADQSFVSYGRDPGSGLLVSQTDQNGKTTRYGYGGPTGNLDGQLASITTPLGDKTTMEYDAAGRVKRMVEPRGNVAGADAATFARTTAYDANGRVTTSTEPGDQGGTSRTTSRTYDGNGNLESATDGRGNTTSYTYDKLNRLSTISAPDGGAVAVTGYTYDRVGNLKTRNARNIVDGVARAQTTSYAYNDDRQLTSVTDPMGGVFRYGYDDSGNLTRVEDANGTATTTTTGDGVTTTTYDTQNRIKTIDYADTDDGSGVDVSYAYRPSGKRASMTDKTGKTVYGYDEPDTERLTSVGHTRAGSTTAQTFRYSYQSTGRIESRTYPDGTVTDYTYDDQQRMKTVVSGGNTTTYHYEAGRQSQTVLPASNGHVETRQYHPSGQLRSIVNAKGATVLSSAAYAYDKAGNPTKVVTEDETVFYSYNQRNMLYLACYKATNTCDTDGPTADEYYKYGYDKVGNRTTKERPVGGTNEVTAYTYNANDQLTLKDGPSGRCGFTYDDNGNQLTECGVTSTYNDANQLTSVTKNVAGTPTTRAYTYDGDGKRLTEGDSSAVTTRYQWDTNNKLPQLARESTGSGALQRRYTQGRDTISMTTGSGTSYYHYDGLGSVTDVTNGAGAKQHEYAYEAFGDLRTSSSTSGAPENKLRYTGEYLDTFTNNYHLRERQYDSHLGRFTQRDPQAATPNDPYVSSYVYTGNQPTLYTDPSGRFFDDTSDWISFAAGAAASLVPGFTVGALAAQAAVAGLQIIFALNDDDDCDARQIASICAQAILGLAGVGPALDLAGYSVTSFIEGITEQLIFEGLSDC